MNKKIQSKFTQKQQEFLLKQYNTRNIIQNFNTVLRNL